MGWWRKVLILPVKRALVAVASRVKSRKDGRGIVKLHNHVRTCEYADVQVMWEMLQRSEMAVHSTKSKRSDDWSAPF